MIDRVVGYAVRGRQLHKESPRRGGCGQARPYDIRVMEHTETDLEGLLEDWRGGRADGADLYPALRQAMYQAARQGIGVITSSDPDPHDVEDAVYRAFRELERQDPANVVSLVGLARKIAYRRGQDAGRNVVRRRVATRADTDHLDWVATTHDIATDDPSDSPAITHRDDGTQLYDDPFCGDESWNSGEFGDSGDNDFGIS
jgi:hypothetical protein